MISVTAPNGTTHPLRILCLFKRRYMRKDVISDRYARLYELPRELARLGHEVLVICLNYRGEGQPFEATDAGGDGRLLWQSCDLGRLLVPGFLRYRRQVSAAIERFAPDILVGGSDSLHAAITRTFAQACDRPFALDLYDNYASFSLSRLPGLAAAYRRALRTADAVSCVSEPLRAMIEREYRPHGLTVTLESTISGALFQPCPQAASRSRYDLPANRLLIGTAGALDASRGTATLFEAYRRLRAERDDIGLVLAGKVHLSVPLPDAPDIYALGELPHTAMAEFFSALDVAVICMRDNEFGRYAFPQKLYEIIACEIPVVAARVGAIAATLSECPGALYDPDNCESLLTSLRFQLAERHRVARRPPTWVEQAARLGALLETVVESRPHRNLRNA